MTQLPLPETREGHFRILRWCGSTQMLLPGRSCHEIAQSGFMTEEECGRQRINLVYVKAFSCVPPVSRSDVLYYVAGFRPHSSPDPFGATLSPGEGFSPPGAFYFFCASIFSASSVRYIHRSVLCSSFASRSVSSSWSCWSLTKSAPQASWFF